MRVFAFGKAQKLTPAENTQYVWIIWKAPESCAQQIAAVRYAQSPRSLPLILYVRDGKGFVTRLQFGFCFWFWFGSVLREPVVFPGSPVKPVPIGSVPRENLVHFFGSSKNRSRITATDFQTERNPHTFFSSFSHVPFHTKFPISGSRGLDVCTTILDTKKPLPK